MRLKLTMVLGFLFACEVIFGQFFPEWTFTKAGFVITNRIVLILSFCGFLFCLAWLLKANKYVLVPWGILLSLFFILTSLGEIYPIDTTTEPEDSALLKTDKEGRKWVVRTYQNAKTGHEIQDTVLVKDKLIFRRLYKYPVTQWR